MINRIVRIILSLLGVFSGVFLSMFAMNLNFVNLGGWQEISIITVTAIVLGIILFLLSPKIIRLSIAIAKSIEKEVMKYSAMDIIYGSGGLIIGFFIAFLISQPFLSIDIPYVGTVISLVLYLLFGYLGITVATRKKDDVPTLGNFNAKKTTIKNKVGAKIQKTGIFPKVLDTSVIIDGRISDICKTGFLEGPIIIPEFVLQELRHIADSSDSLKRNRGRRGLDILNLLQKEDSIEVIIESKDYGHDVEVDVKLLKLAEDLGGKVLTNDYNLNKVAEFQGVQVLNINELANAVKPVVLPGEEMAITIVKDGKESNQGLAYLDDGTMIVVENGRRRIGEAVTVIVTSVLQTAAGRMIFAKLK